EGVSTDGPWLLTRNRVSGVSVYGESLPREGGTEYRRWDANRSKLAAYLRCGGRVWGFRGDASVLYLGAGSGTTASHVSDICREGTITAIERHGWGAAAHFRGGETGTRQGGHEGPRPPDPRPVSIGPCGPRRAKAIASSTDKDSCWPWRDRPGGRIVDSRATTI